MVGATHEDEVEDACFAGHPLSDATLDYPTGLHVRGNHIEDGLGNTITYSGSRVSKRTSS